MRRVLATYEPLASMPGHIITISVVTFNLDGCILTRRSLLRREALNDRLHIRAVRSNHLFNLVHLHAASLGDLEVLQARTQAPADFEFYFDAVFGTFFDDGSVALAFQLGDTLWTAQIQRDGSLQAG